MSLDSGAPAVFLDRDGVIIEDGGHAFKDDQLVFVRGAPEAIRRLNRLGYMAVVVTNQPGVGRGLFTEGQMHGFNSLMVRRLAARQAIIGAVYCCPYDDQAEDPVWRHPDHPDRMPNPGMILRAARERGLDPARSFLIGAGDQTLEAGRRAAISGFRFEGGDLDAFVRELLGG